MTERELGRALLRWDGAGAADPAEVTRRVLERDRRRVWWAAAVTTLLWVLVAVGLLTVVWYFLAYVHPKVLLHLRTGEPLPRDSEHTWGLVFEYVALWLGGVFVLVLAAAVSTVALVALSRRATVRQVNASLIELSEALGRLQRSLDRPPPAAGG